jgi:hypothetical protein
VLRLVFALAPALLVIAPRPGLAYQGFPWCAQYADRSFARTCAFATYQACIATVGIGVGGYCFANPAAPPLPVAVLPPATRHHRRPPH